MANSFFRIGNAGGLIERVMGVRFRCGCGNIISDTRENLPYKAYYLKDIDMEVYFEQVIKDIAAFIEAVKKDTKEEWLCKTFGDIYPKDLENSSVVFDLIDRIRIQYEEAIYQCDVCGMVHFSEKGQDVLKAFKPIGDDDNGLFSKKTE